MATITRTKSASRVSLSPLSTSQLPTPFPVELLHHCQKSNPGHPHSEEENTADVTAGPSRQEATIDQYAEQNHTFDDLLPSIVFVQKACLNTLNNLLSAPTRWHPIVPDRRHSLPSTAQDTMTTEDTLAFSALRTLVSNLRNHDSSSGLRASTNKSDLIDELRSRVGKISATLDPAEAALANSLVALVSHFHRLTEVQATSPVCIAERHDHLPSPTDCRSPLDVFDTLKRQLSDFQTEHLSSRHEMATRAAAPTTVVETALLWLRIDAELENVVSMCKSRTEALSRQAEHGVDHLPPKYSNDDYEYPPDYEPGLRLSTGCQDVKLSDADVRHATTEWQMEEKMRLDLEAVTMAIDRLYLVAPQLNNQRVELKSSKLAQMEKARSLGPSASRSVNKGKGKQETPDIKELENLMNMLKKAYDRSYKDQSVILEGGMESRLEKARMREVAKETALLERLALHSDAGRIHGQDATFPTRVNDSERFQEAVTQDGLLSDPEALLTLSEFIKESATFAKSRPPPDYNGAMKNRDRSSSAPSLSWFRSTSSKLSNYTHRPKSGGPGEFGVSYVAENHDSLCHVLVFLTLSDPTTGVDLEGEVPQSPSKPNQEGNNILVIRSGSLRTTLSLPEYVLPGKYALRARASHFEIKLPTVTLQRPPSENAEEADLLVGASKLTSARPDKFLCAVCSLELVQSSQIKAYRDLPSEHWEELVEAWMCHADQRLHDEVMKHGRGNFWPQPLQALVGGTYILFNESMVVRDGIRIAGDGDADINEKNSRRIVQCQCGATIGHRLVGSEADPVAYKLSKYAIRPVSTMHPIPNFPLTAYIVTDMIELVRAHASYRFLVKDEETETPRILIWLFKPSMRISYHGPLSHAMPRQATIKGAKVLYQNLGPSVVVTDVASILDRYPGFSQAEHLIYPMSVCYQLETYLRESNLAYPEHMRKLMGMDVGWLAHSSA